MKEFIKKELSGWNKWEVSWLVLATTIITLLSIYWGDTTMGIISSVTGVICVICTGKGKLSAYIFGLINSILYAIIAYKATYYGETMLNALYYVPMQFVGFYTWSKHMNSETNEVVKKRMSVKNRIYMILIIAISVFIYGLFLEHLGDAMPFVDSFTTVSSIAAMCISVKMYMEQWWIWIFINVFSVFMWYINFMNGSDNMATLLMWCVYLLNSVIMLIKWNKESKQLEEMVG